MGPVAERLVLRSSPSTEGEPGVLPDQVAARVLDADLPANEQRAVGAELDRRVRGSRLLVTAVHTAEVERAGRTAHHDIGDLVGRCRVHLDPRVAPGVEDRRQAIQAIRRMDAVRGLPRYHDLVVGVFLRDPGPVPSFVARPETLVRGGHARPSARWASASPRASGASSRSGPLPAAAITSLP